MSSASPVASIGVDFGTSNSVVALAAADGRVETVRFTHANEVHNVFTSALCFWPERRGSGLPPHVEGGPWAIEHFLQEHAALRFIQSFKTFAASRAFQSTTIFGQRFAFEDLLAAFLRTLHRHADSALDLASAPVVIGRPVHFAGANPDEALAMQRYRDAYARFGVEKALYVYEPVGAAFSFARQLKGDATVLVADFGGGTSDFSIVRFSREAGNLRVDPLAHGGIGIAGDTFDARMVEHVVSPRLGWGSEYRSFGKLLPIPNQYFSHLSRWHELAMMKTGSDLVELRELAAAAVNPGPLEDFITLVEFDLGFPLYRAISDAKIALSAQEEIAFRFDEEGIAIHADISRAEFESWIANDLARIAAIVDRTLDQAGLAPDAVDRVFLTGGSSFVPAVRNLFVERFGDEKLLSADQFESIAYGLALIGQARNPDQWAIRA